jgi:hypothetical protein
MADSKVSALTNIAVADLDGATEWHVNDGGSDRALALDDLVTKLQQSYGLPRIKRLASDHAISSTTATEVTDLSITLEAGTYCFDYRLICQSATTTVGIFFGVNYTGTATEFNYWMEYSDAATALTASSGIMDDVFGLATGGFHVSLAQNAEHTTTAPTGTTSGVAVVNSDFLVVIRGIMVVSDSGDLELWHKSETATSTTVELGSSLVVIRTA